MWDGLFSVVTVVAMLAWVLLLVAPRKPLTHSTILYLGVTLLCLVYTVCLIAIQTGWLDRAVAVAGGARPGFANLAQVRAIFASDGGTLIGWTHYLAFDLFVGLWIARDADAKGFSRLTQAPVLVLTFLLGPVGLLVWMVVRERRARAVGRR